MKKLIVSTLLITSITGTYYSATPAEAASRCVDQNTKLVKLPNFKSKTTLTQMKKGQFVFKGYKYADSYSKALRSFGQPGEITVERASYGTLGQMNYGDFTVVMYSKNRNEKLQNLKGQEMIFEVGVKSKISQGTIEQSLGKSTRTDMTTKSTKFLSYGKHTAVSYKKVKGVWIAQEIHYGIESSTSEYKSSTGKLTKLKTKPLSSKDLKAMTQKKYQISGVKLGASPASVKKLVGYSNHELNTLIPVHQALVQAYGDMDWVEMYYEAPKCDEQYRLTNILFDYSNMKVPFSSIEKVLGKAKKVETTSYMDGKTKVNQKTYYYKNIEVHTEVVGKKYMVNSVIYGS
ncbi:hypothetical protein [Macrococcus sp. DPC7161]|uniref:hypothetical protein n=1 Tax=Macrococcus sp. DPC7161 TaxID=2507060 RepID=UPI00100AF728|nr:hypothetical protein [Macrococcus sp. DPC7161]RXK17412.1 hypothetical protein ER639_10535 [Macrococcus sp. DPC7161]